MVCENCDPALNKPGKLIKTNKFGPGMACAICGDRLGALRSDYHGAKLKRWDNYFHDICVSVSSKSPCLSRQIGSLLVRDKVVIATGFNGPPRNYPHCEAILIPMEDYRVDGEEHFSRVCPRKAQGYKSGEGLHLCPATHAEANCIASAARIGASVKNSTLYLNCIIPCKDCMSLIINAGIIEVVCDKAEPYHEMSLEMAKHAGIKIRGFVL